mmetsp:Transcript_62270/g.138712  ORF Transcript_62270/g.138712 Transcript_62270/m.138712 type:complete len:223 (-) Transcript_62270:259-927(-)
MVVGELTAAQKPSPARPEERTINHTRRAALQSRPCDGNVVAHTVREAQPLELSLHTIKHGGLYRRLASACPQQELAVWNTLQDRRDVHERSLRQAHRHREDDRFTGQAVLRADAGHFSHVLCGVRLLGPNRSDAPAKREKRLRAVPAPEWDEQARRYANRSSLVWPRKHVGVEPNGLAVHLQLPPPLLEQLEARLHGGCILEVELEVARAVREAAVEKFGKG